MSVTIKPVAWMCPVDVGDGPDISCNLEYVSLFKGSAVPLYTADAVASIVRDAERYRWLRDSSSLTWKSLRNKWLMTAKQVDDRIDSEMEES